MEYMVDNNWDVLVVGGGPAGMMAAIAARRDGAKVAIVEKNKNLGRKMLLTGGGRCNLTNISPTVQFMQSVPGHGKFLFSALSVFSGRRCVDFFNEIGVPTKVEEEGKVFPLSNRAADVVEALRKHLVELGVVILNEIQVSELILENNACIGVKTQNGKAIKSQALVLATGGVSFLSTGSTGDGYRFAARCGHKIIPALPGLVSLCFKDNSNAKNLQGLSLKGAVITLVIGNKKFDVQQGDVIFTHFGLSGPAALKISRTVSSLISQGASSVQIFVDTMPKYKVEDLLGQMLSLSRQNPKKSVLTILKLLVPYRLACLVLEILDLDNQKKAGETGKDTWGKVSVLLKKLPFILSGTRPLKEAMVSVGGVCIREVAPKSMASHLVSGLYFAGELLDVDAYTGGYNMQIAFSTGWLAGMSAAKKVSDERIKN